MAKIIDTKTDTGDAVRKVLAGEKPGAKTPNNNNNNNNNNKSPSKNNNSSSKSSSSKTNAAKNNTSSSRRGSVKDVDKNEKNKDKNSSRERWGLEPVTVVVASCLRGRGFIPSPHLGMLNGEKSDSLQIGA